ncbi:MAG: radical SAM protein [Chloroflexi bacterium]|nr:radical SAM protein [Chloroflexota bacterium]
MTVANSASRLITNVVSSIASESGTRILYNPTVRGHIVRSIEKQLVNDYKHVNLDEKAAPGLERDRLMMSLAILGTVDRAFAENLLSPSAIKEVAEVLVKGLFVNSGEQNAVQAFKDEHSIRPPTFLVISPGKACNLRCTGCYANSTDSREALSWDTVDRIINEAKTMWGTRFFVFSGGEPFVWRSGGKGLLDIVEKNRDCMFMAYTNGTMIDDKMSKRLAETGNLMPAISLEGWQESTDKRRGEGIFDKTVALMARLRSDGVPFGSSLTATRDNAEELLSKDYMDFLIKQGVLFTWIFQYMPIGRAFTLEMMPTPEQRLWMWRRAWEVLRSRKMVIADFWNSGTVVDGCLSAGGHGRGGYLYIDWNGNISPCVFVPYAPVNINKIYADGGTLNDAWGDPFFEGIRSWQKDYMKDKHNVLAPCPYRDHYNELQQIVREHEPDPTDGGSLTALTDPEFAQGLTEYGQDYMHLTNEIWEQDYLQVGDARDITKHPSENKPKAKVN